MKRIVKSMIIPLMAVYLTSLWNQGFIIPADLLDISKLTLIIGIIYYLLGPLSKLLLLPLNIISLGLASFIFYLILLHIVGSYLDLVEINAWTIANTRVSYLGNLVLSSISLSSIIKTLEKVFD